MEQLLNLGGIPIEMGKPLTTRDRVDKHLTVIASINATLGIDSTEEEIGKANKEINSHLAEIFKLDPDFFKIIQSDELHVFKTKHQIE